MEGHFRSYKILLKLQNEDKTRRYKDARSFHEDADCGIMVHFNFKNENWKVELKNKNV